VNKKNFNWRGFISLYITISFLVMSVSGIILFFSPPGRIAHWSYWEFLWLTKEGWQAVHTIFTFIFIVMTGFHIYFNWKPLIAYLKTKFQTQVKLRKELLFAVLFSFVIFAMTLLGTPPFSTVMDFGEDLSNSWGNSDTEPPVPHAEELTLIAFAEVIKLPLPDLIEKLNKSGFKVNDGTITVQKLADQNNAAPSDIFKMLKEDNSEKIIHRSIGSGYGRKTIAELCKDLQITPEEGIALLEAKNISAKADEKVKNVAERYRLIPVDIMNILKGSL